MFDALLTTFLALCAGVAIHRNWIEIKSGIRSFCAISNEIAVIDLRLHETARAIRLGRAICRELGE